MPRYISRESQGTVDYPNLREALAPHLRSRPAEDIEAIFESYNLSAEDMEGFFDTLKDIGKAVASAAPAILPAVGTAVGTIYGGPAGAAIGGQLGNLAGGLIGQAAGSQPAQAPPPRAAAAPQIPQAPPGASPAANQMMQAMFRPETLQALMQMILGQLGGSNVRVGSTPVPVGAFANLVGTLANQAQAEYQAANMGAREGLPEYLRNYANEAVGDPAVAEQRAGALLELLQETDVEQYRPRHRRSRATAYPGPAGEEEVFYVKADGW